jgi:CRP-like cAMP-binding protein
MLFKRRKLFFEVNPKRERYGHNMVENEEVIVPHLLKYKKGELIIKEGDYGVSIYKILKGKVIIFTEVDGKEIPYATLGEGEILGEMLFLKQSIERRSASVRTLEDSEIEIWHPSMLAREYEQMPPVIRSIANQALNRLMRMNKLLVQLTSKRQRQREVANADIWAKKRRFYRKKMEIGFTGRQINSPAKSLISGYITDMSLGGVGMEITSIKLIKNPFKAGDDFYIKTTLPNGKDLEFHSKLISIKEGKIPGMPSFGMSFTELTDSARKDLGFFLMP